MEKVLLIMIILVAVKAIVIGSDFSFHYLFKDGKKYLDWYKNRPNYLNWFKTLRDKLWEE